MIRKILVNLSAEHPEIPLIEAATFVGSPSAVFVRGIPQAVGSWRITSVKVVATYPDDSAPTVECVKGADGVYVATIPATATSGRVANGLQIIADGIDERGEPVTGYVLGMADFAVYLRDMTIEGATGVKYYLHLLDAEPDDPKEGDAYLDGSTLNIYHDGEWTEIAGGGYEPPPGGIPKTDLSAGVQESLNKADSALQNSGDQTLNGTLSVKHTRIEEHKIVYDVGAAGESNLMFPVGQNDYLAVLSDIYAAVQQIAPAWVGLTSYAQNALVSYNGVVYRKKTIGSSPTSAPSGDTTNWEAKKVSEIFLPLTGGMMTGPISAKYIYADNKIYANDGYHFGGAEHAGIDSDEIYVGANHYDWAQRSGTFALLQNLAPDFSFSATYAVGQLCVYNKKLYRCTTAITTSEAWTDAHWTEATVEDVLAAIRSALGDKAPLASPAFTGTPTAPTPAAGDDSTKVATTAFVQSAVAGVTPNLDYVMRVDPETGGIYYTTPDTNA